MIEKITTQTDVTLISLNDSPADIRVTADVFARIAQAGVDVDMISQCPLGGTHAGLSFTIKDEDFGKVLPVVSALRAEHKGVTVSVSSGNCKISVFGQFMLGMPGVAAKVLYAAADGNADLRMITTSETDISLLVGKADLEPAAAAIQAAFA